MWILYWYHIMMKISEICHGSRLDKHVRIGLFETRKLSMANPSPMIKLISSNKHRNQKKAFILLNSYYIIFKLQILNSAIKISNLLKNTSFKYYIWFLLSCQIAANDATAYSFRLFQSIAKSKQLKLLLTNPNMQIFSWTRICTFNWT